MQPFELVKFCPRCGVAIRTPPAIPFRCAACSLELYFNPTVSVSAFIRQIDGTILLIRRAKAPGKGMLATIGGFVDIGESAESALRREIREEVHLEIDDITFLCSAPNRYNYSGVDYPVLDLFFWCRALPGSGARTGEDVESLVMLPLTELPADELAFDSMREALLVLRSRDAD